MKRHDSQANVPTARNADDGGTPALLPVSPEASSGAVARTVGTLARTVHRPKRAERPNTQRLEQELREMSGRLVHASENERTRLARELHDDVAQRLALIANGLSQLRRQVAGSSDEIRRKVATLSDAVVDLCSELHRFSRELHPRRLEELGLDAAVRATCSEIRAATGLDVSVDSSDLPAGVSGDAALCVYRIAQEALHNVVKHSGAKRADVLLTRVGNDIVLRVVDQGVGFASDMLRGTDSLGFTSMRERARLVDASLHVASRRGHGTAIELRVPIARALRTMKSAG
jgi:signal transduction histidine kinase